MSHCICTPHHSGNNSKCDECHPNRKKPSGIKQTWREKHVREANGERLGEILEAREPKPEDLVDD